MSETFKIEKGLPLPLRGESGRARKYPFDEMAVGDSFFAPGVAQNKITGSLSQARARTGFEFTVRTVTENGVTGVRIWRFK